MHPPCPPCKGGKESEELLNGGKGSGAAMASGMHPPLPPLVKGGKESEELLNGGKGSGAAMASGMHPPLAPPC